MGIHDGHRANMRRRFLANELDGFASHEALELLLYYAIPRRDTNAIAHALMERYGSLSGVLFAPVEDLQKVDGVGENTALLLHLVAPMFRTAMLTDKEVVLSTPERIGEYLTLLFYGKRQEYADQLCLDQKGRLLACRELVRGASASVSVDVRLVAENAILTAASSVILAHNHPSGLALPSQEDYAFTDRAAAALNAVGIPLTDHIILADNDYVSMADSGFLRREIGKER